MNLTSETRYRIGTVMMAVGLLSTLSVVGMAWGVPLLMWGWDIRRRMTRDMEERAAATAAD